MLLREPIVDAFISSSLIDHVPPEVRRLIAERLNILDARTLCCTCRLACGAFTRVVRRWTTSPSINIHRIRACALIARDILSIYSTASPPSRDFDNGIAIAAIEVYDHMRTACHPLRSINAEFMMKGLLIAAVDLF